MESETGAQSTGSVQRGGNTMGSTVVTGVTEGSSVGETREARWGFP